VTHAELLVELEAVGVRLSLAGDDLRFQTRPGVSIAPYRERIVRRKTVLVALLHLQGEIVSAATAARDAFDRQYYDELWRRWYALQKQETTHS
jgi:hypothetical protein